jgi:hypothetical protein
MTQFDTLAACRLGHCRMPRSGGPCETCGYPRARAHESSISDALDRCDEVYVGGTALIVEADSRVSPGWLVIESRASASISCTTYQISGVISDLTDYQCYLRWYTNRAFIEMGKAVPFELTPDQIARGRRLNQEEAARLNQEASRSPDRCREGG